MEITRLLNRLQCCPLPSSWWKKLDPPLKTKLPFLWDGIAVSLKWNSFLEKLTWIDPHILWNRVQCLSKWLSDQYPEKLINKNFACIFCVWSWKTQTGKPLCLFGSYFQPYIFLDILNWTSLMPLVKVWWADHILFPLFKNPKNHYTISVFPSSSLQSSMGSRRLFLIPSFDSFEAKTW